MSQPKLPGQAADGVPGWEELLPRLAETPRENGSAALHETAAWLVDLLRGAGLDVVGVSFTAHPYGLRLAGLVSLLGALLYAWLAFTGRWRAALATALALPALLLLQLDYYVPLFAWIGSEEQRHVVARLPAARAEQRLVLAAHYDSKTDLLDHAQRAIVEKVAAPAAPLMILGAVAGALAGRFPRRRRILAGLGRGAGVAAGIYGGATFLAISGGVFVPERSPGAIDDGAACAVLVRLAGALAQAPPERTEVEVLLLSAEEVGVQGSWVYAAQRFAQPPELPTWVVNLEGIGVSAQHAVLGRERFLLRSFEPDRRLVERLAAVHRNRLGSALAVAPAGGATDARSFLAHGVPAATLVSREPGASFPRHLHSAADSRDRLDEAALEASVAYLLALVRDVDREPL